MLGRLEGERLPRLALNIELGSSRLWAEGAFGRPEDRLEFRLDAPSVGPLSASAIESSTAEYVAGTTVHSPLTRCTVSMTAVV